MKNRWIIFIATIITITIFVNIGYSVPAPQRLALNHETKECAMYWAGDEFTYYELPRGWKSYYINYTSGFVETEIGNCSINPRTNGFEECCNQLGYTFVSGNIGETTKEKLPTGGLGEALLGWIVIGGLVFLFIIVPIIVISLITIIIYFVIVRKGKKGKKK